MKLIIDINEKVYNRVQSLEPRKDGVMLLDTLMCAVQDSTPLDDIKAEIKEWHNMKHSSLSDTNYQIMLDIIDKHISR